MRLYILQTDEGYREEVWFLNRLTHRESDAAITYASGVKFYYKNGIGYSNKTLLIEQ